MSQLMDEARPGVARRYLADFFKYVRQYREALSRLGDDTGLWPQMQISGLAIELSLKTFMCANGIIGLKRGDAGHGHDLEQLAGEAFTAGLVLTDHDVTQKIADINELYNLHDGLRANYLCRYPMPDRPLLVSTTPGYKSIDEFSGRIIGQAKRIAGT